ncbi:conserved hypothetical protein [Leishmania major strain Friedlin]|uniref:CID domain-containing protein n=1 Tax=Leishmania major TaxID=5664 RepID=Q4QCF7_LEIMA|nr:conserved hypothetical protein [Leishmania major strain Friedlin]CAG9573343.1 hypothetical_protein_-_conserved [Leishmania major strain Friedlin]CAJ04101.1 conserved hypothetical protein [Leishmania major strain Friedlin]|eukprot:XP_001682991.1 conserved hypothetical protein [Leishmania major strain Friedlin]
MDTFQATLDELQRESKEKIAHAQDTASAAVLQARVVPHRIAVAMAQRFTSDRVESCFPVLCLLDATLARTASASPSTSSEADQALAAILAEFWTLAPAAFMSVHGAGQPAWREKCLRLVRRWKQRRLVPEPLITELLTAMEKGTVKAEAGEATSVTEVSSNATAAAGISSSSSLAIAAAATTSGQPSPSTTVTATAATNAAMASPSASYLVSTPSFTAAQARAFRSTLQACLSALESLQPARAALYLELVRSQHFRAPSRTSLAFFEDLLKELRREVTMASSSSSPNQAASAGGGTGAKDGADPASNGHARETLGKLLDQLHVAAGEGAAGLSAGGRVAAAGVAGAGAHHSAATTVVRYVSPIFSDIYARQALGQRGTGFGTLQRKAGHGGPSGGSAVYTSYYPKAEANAQRPFRIPPARQMQGGAVRLHFPRQQEWVSAQDMADVSQYASRGITDRGRKRTREGV